VVEEIRGGALSSRYAEAERKTGEQIGPTQRRAKEEEEGVWASRRTGLEGVWALAPVVLQWPRCGDAIVA
jgi:hypothetical protein